MNNNSLSPGILELYALGILSPDESADVDHILAENPDLQQEFKAIEDDLEQFANAQSKNPPPYIRAQVMNAIGAQQKASGDSRNNPSQPHTSQSSRYWIIASAGIVGIALVSSLFLLNNLKNERNTLASLQKENEKLATMIDERTVSLGAQNNILSILASSNVSSFSAVDQFGETKGRLYWNRSDRKALFIVAKPVQQLTATMYYSDKTTENIPLTSEESKQAYLLQINKAADSVLITDVAVQSVNGFGNASIKIQKEKPLIKRNTLRKINLPKTGM